MSINNNFKSTTISVDYAAAVARVTERVCMHMCADLGLKTELILKASKSGTIFKTIDIDADAVGTIAIARIQ